MWRLRAELLTCLCLTGGGGVESGAGGAGHGQAAPAVPVHPVQRSAGGVRPLLEEHPAAFTASLRRRCDTRRSSPRRRHCGVASRLPSVADAASWPEVQRFLHQSVFESMPLTTPDHNGVLERRPALPGPAAPVLPWDDPPTFADLQLKNKRAQGGVTASMTC